MCSIYATVQKICNSYVISFKFTKQNEILESMLYETSKCRNVELKYFEVKSTEKCISIHIRGPYSYNL